WCAERIDNGARLAVDLFAGAGGLSLGMEQAGWTVAASVDNNRFALQTHRTNFPGLAVNADLGDPKQRNRVVRLLRKTTIDLLAGGPPCQPFSRAGRSKIRSLVHAGIRDEHDERKELWHAYLDVALRVRPRAVLMENVPDMALGDDFEVVRTIVDTLEEAGYRTSIQLVDAWKFGVPQHRKRLIVLARNDSDAFAWPQPGNEVNLRDAIGDLPKLNGSTGARVLPYTEPDELSDFAALMRKGSPDEQVWDHMTRPVREDDLEIFRQMTSQTLYADIDPKLRRYKADTFDDKYKRLGWDERSRSITAHIAKDGYWYIHPEEHRTLTVREAARIQTFPDYYRFAGSRSHAFQQIGNAVPPLLGQAAATALRPTPDAGRQRNNPSRVLRGMLTRWARQRRAGHYWCVLPGPQLGPATAATVALIGPTPVELTSLNQCLREIAHSGCITRKALNLLEEAPSSRSVAKAVEKLRQFQGSNAIWRQPEDLIARLRLPPAKTALLRLLVGDDLLLVTQPTLRVASRVLDTNSHKTNSLTDGKADLSRLVGGGADAPLRMAALRLISQLYCHPTNPLCDQCPLLKKCAQAQPNKARS
ncbi:MAG: DNA (cytosine-5-)-methyltransferase, partial [Acidimicrobiia bacterium]